MAGHPSVPHSNEELLPVQRRASLVSTRLHHRASRAGLALALVLSMGFALVARSDVQAQDTELLSTATVAPANAAIYAEIKLDPENAELQQLDELFLRLGSDESLIAAIQG